MSLKKYAWSFCMGSLPWMHAGSTVQLDAAASFSVSPDIVPDSFALPDKVLDSSFTSNSSAHYSAFVRAAIVTSLQVDTVVAIVS